MKIVSTPNAMELEKEIQQTKFKSEQHKAVLNILFTASWINCRHQRLFKEFGLTPEQYNVMRILRGQKGSPISVNGIQERMIDRSSNASRLVDKLEQKAFAVRRACPNDRRQVDIVITEQGLELLKKMDEQLEVLEAAGLLLSDADAATLNRILDGIREEKTT